MNDGGVPLTSREAEWFGKYSLNIMANRNESLAYMHALRSIHHAGVRHCDIGSENLVINADGEVFIIDFNRSELNATQESHKRELDGLKDLLNGRYVDVFYSF